ncbi:MAG: YqeG family HAD IIIA-type phosphatase [Lactobacillaceae bacterium]|jgi:HAD superfamily phosphatase (TIGR01668 family)|nr:YqeG family HAD IIIA-type phosphatase [Lactobacillaceae bacterium]
MASIFEPTYFIEKIWDIEPDTLKKLGVTAVLADLDNTLVAWNKRDGDERFFEWNEKLKNNNIQLIVVSNNTTSRVRRAVKPLGLPFESWSLKPLPRGILKTLKDFNLSKNEVVMVGDQLMTDIIASNIAGVKSVLVKPLVSSDGIMTKINRGLANKILSKMDVKWEKDLVEPNRD